MASVLASTRIGTIARVLLASSFLAVAFASVTHSLPGTVNTLTQDRRALAQLTNSQRSNYWRGQAPLPAAVIDFYRAHVGPGDRFYVQAPRGTGELLNNALVVAGYGLLPNAMVARPAEADVILSYQDDPRTLRLHYTRIDQFRPGVTAARVARAR